MSQKREKNKRARAERERKYARRKAAAAAPFRKGYSTPIMQHFVFDNPFNGLDTGEQRELFQKVGQDAERAFAAGVENLNTLIRKHDPIQLLATVSFYTQFQGVGPKTDFTESPKFSQAHAETLQSLCLRADRGQYGDAPVLPPDLSKLLDELTGAAASFATKRYQSLATVEVEEKDLLVAIEGARLHTQLMRNWGYPQHMRAIHAELFEPLDERIRRKIGFSAAQLLQLACGIHDTVCERALEFLTGFAEACAQKSPRTIVATFCRLAHASGEDEARILEFVAARSVSNRQLKFFLLSYFHQYLPAVFTFTVEECLGFMPTGGDRQQLKSVLDALSIPFGGLSAVPCEHLFMQSEIRTKPLIRAEGDAYFVPVVGLLHSHFVEIVEALVFDDLALKDVYHKRRSVYLEDTVARMARDSFPGCPVRTGTKWVHPADGREYETDCFVVVGPVAIVFEAKSERVDDPARRGARNTLKNHYKSLVQEPALQATRFAQLLESGHGVRTFTTTAGEGYELDLSPIRRVVSVSVTLDWFPATGMCWRRLLAAGLVTDRERPSVHLSLADLMVLFDVLTTPAVLVHYFWRRSEWEGHVDYLGDEEDLLVYYLSEGLLIAEPLRNGSAVINLYGRSDELHRHYMAAWAGDESVPRPRRILTQWWAAVLHRTEERAIPQKWDIAGVLLDFSYSQQEEFGARFRELIAAVRGNRSEHNGIIFSPGRSESCGAVVGFAYRSLNREDRNARAYDLAGQARTSYGAERVVVIGHDVDCADTPYSFLALVDHTLVDTPAAAGRVTSADSLPPITPG